LESWIVWARRIAANVAKLPELLLCDAVTAVTLWASPVAQNRIK
jgi:hypothetical protein